jgi:ABC-type Zn2+ transport system substrate-binding protein/surface adhesin
MAAPLDDVICAVTPLRSMPSAQLKGIGAGEIVIRPTASLH